MINKDSRMDQEQGSVAAIYEQVARVLSALGRVSATC